jgi:hypothetical protein
MPPRRLRTVASARPSFAKALSGPPGTRTPNLWIKSPQLCLIELAARGSQGTGRTGTPRTRLAQCGVSPGQRRFPVTCTAPLRRPLEVVERSKSFISAVTAPKPPCRGRHRSRTRQARVVGGCRRRSLRWRPQLLLAERKATTRAPPDRLVDRATPARRARYRDMDGAAGRVGAVERPQPAGERQPDIADTATVIGSCRSAAACGAAVELVPNAQWRTARPVLDRYQVLLPIAGLPRCCLDQQLPEQLAASRAGATARQSAVPERGRVRRSPGGQPRRRHPRRDPRREPGSWVLAGAFAGGSDQDSSSAACGRSNPIPASAR